MKSLKIIVLLVVSLFIVAIIFRCSNSEEYNYVENGVSSVYSEDNEDAQSNVKDSVVRDNTKESISYEKAKYNSVNLDASIIEEGLPNRLEIPRLVRLRAAQIIEHEGYTCSFNVDTKNSNWVAWRLTKEHASGPWSRKGIQYMEDPLVVGQGQELSDWDYHNLSIDHGHMCPAGDNKWSEDAMVQTFYLTNMCPQNSNLNRGIWENLESRCRGWAKQYNEIFIVAGPIFYNENYQTIGHNKVGVPDAFFKVVLCLTKKPKALGFIFPNTTPEYSHIRDYLFSVDEVEEIAGIDFFYNLEDSIEELVESTSELSLW